MNGTAPAHTKGATTGPELRSDIWRAHDPGYIRQLDDINVFVFYAQATSTRLVKYTRAKSLQGRSWLGAYAKHGSEVHYFFTPANSPSIPARAESLMAFLKNKRNGPEVRIE